jgi:biopolymer transport protein ExbD
MGHSLSSEIKAEPNLIPLLDLVFQLLMFFIVCVNFVTQQVNERIKLPEMQSARPMDKRETDVLYLNLDAQGTLEVIGQESLKNPLEMLVYLRREYEDARRLAHEKNKSDEVKTTVIIRADRAVEYKDVFKLLDMCKNVGYRKFQIRAQTKGASG